MAGLIDKDAELSRLTKAMEKANQELQRVSGKLSNEKFVSNAPPAVIEKEQAKMAEYQQTVDKLKEQYAEIEAI
jgi:valyl-tRNA synthetase